MRVLVLVAFLFLASTAWATTEDLTSYTETDPNSRITVNATTATFADIARNESAWVAKDKGAAHFNGNFTHDFEFQYTSAVGNSGWVAVWGVSNALEDFFTGLAASNLSLHASIYNNTGTPECYLANYFDGVEYYGNLTFTISAGTTYYATANRDESVGTYGTLYLSLYADAANRTAATNAIGKSYVTLNATTDFQYLYAVNSFNTDVGTSPALSGFTAKFDLHESSPPVAATSGQIIFID